MNTIFEFLVLISKCTLMSSLFYPYKSKSCRRDTYTVLLSDQDKIMYCMTTVEPLFRGPSRDQDKS